MDERQAEAVELLRRVGHGDRAALEALYALLEQPVHRYARSRLNDTAAADDVLNETMLEVWKNAMKYREASRVTTWVLGIARHKIIDHQRREGRHGHEALDPALPDRDTPPVADALAALQDGERLRRCLETLSESQRETVHLAFYQELPYAEIASITDCPEGTVKTRIHYAKQALKRCLAGAAA